MKLLVVEVTDELEIGGAPGQFGPQKTRQVAYLHGESAYPDKWVMRYEHTRKPVEPGFYLFGSGAYRMGKWGPEVSAPELVKLDEAVKELQGRLTQPSARAAA